MVIKNVKRAAQSGHQRTSARLQAPIPKCVLVRRMVSAISAHDFNQNLNILGVRARGTDKNDPNFFANGFDGCEPMKRWHTIRSDKCQALKAAAQALVLHADFSLDGEYLFEVKASRRVLAQDAGLAIAYSAEECNPSIHPHGRIDTSRLDRCIRDLFWAGLIYLAQEQKTPSRRELERRMEWDTTGCVYQKIGRIFLTPAFFAAFGFSREEVIRAINAKRRHQEKLGRPKQSLTKRSLWSQNYLQRNLAKVSHELHQRLDRIRQEYLALERELTQKSKDEERKKLDDNLPPIEQLRRSYYLVEELAKESRGNAWLIAFHQAIQNDEPDIIQGSEEYMRRFIALYKATIN